VLTRTKGTCQKHAGTRTSRSGLSCPSDMEQLPRVICWNYPCCLFERPVLLPGGFAGDGFVLCCFSFACKCACLSHIISGINGLFMRKRLKDNHAFVLAYSGLCFHLWCSILMYIHATNLTNGIMFHRVCAKLCHLLNLHRVAVLVAGHALVARRLISALAAGKDVND